MNIFLMEHPRHIPESFRNDIANTPLSSALITASLRSQLEAEGHTVAVSEGFLAKKTFAQQGAEILAFRPQLLGVHLIYQWDDHQELFDFLAAIAKEHPMRIVLYGFYPTFAHRQLLAKAPGLFDIVTGEPEQAFTALAANVPLPRVPGLCFLDDRGELQVNPREMLTDLDLLPHPVRSPELLSLREINVEGSRGCYNQCTFCHINPYYGPKAGWRGHSADYVCAEIEDLMAKTGKNRFYFTDPNFFGPGEKGQRRGLGLAKRFKPYGIRFGIEARVNDIREDSIEALAEAGLDEILIGLESGSDAGLARLHKNTTVAQNERALSILRSAGIKPNVGFIMFEPKSTLANVRVNVDFLLRNQLLTDLDITVNLLYHQQILLQGTAAYCHFAEEEETAYHIRPGYENRKVALLASLMRRLSNCVFFYLNPLRQMESPDMDKAHRDINDLLVHSFLYCLDMLEKDPFFSEMDVKDLAAEAEMDIAAKLRGLYFTAPAATAQPHWSLRQ